MVMAQIWRMNVDDAMNVDLITVYFIDAAVANHCTASSSKERHGYG
jgi:hypothetical protein